MAKRYYKRCINFQSHQFLVFSSTIARNRLDFYPTNIVDIYLLYTIKNMEILKVQYTFKITIYFFILHSNVVNKLGAHLVPLV